MTSMFPGNNSTTRKPQHERQQLSMLRRQLLEQIMRGEGSGAPAYLDKHQKAMWEGMVSLYRKKSIITADSLASKGLMLLKLLREGKAVSIVAEKELMANG